MMQFVFILFAKWGIFALFLLILLEYACLPIPSEIILPFAGFIAGLNEYNIIGVILFSIIMGYIGCLICYLIGYYGGANIYNKIYNKFLKWRKGLDFAESTFAKYGNISVFIGRLIPLCRTYISFLAGLFKQSLFKYSLFSLLGISIWNTMLIIFGYIFMSKWNIVSEYYNKYKIIVLFLIIIIIVIILLYKLYKKKKTNKNY